MFGRAISEALGTAPGDASTAQADPAAAGRKAAAPRPNGGSDDDAVSGASPRSETRSFSERAGDPHQNPCLATLNLILISMLT